MSRLGGLLFTLSLTLLSACAERPSEPCPETMASLSSVSEGPSALIIGDSISMGYGPHLRASALGIDVQHNPCNAYDSGNTVRNISAWLSAKDRWTFVTFNNGIWDQTLGETWTSESEYRRNLAQIARQVRERTDCPLFLLTTEIPRLTPERSDARVVRRNEIAREVMSSEGIPVLDLYTFSQTIRSEHIRAEAEDDVHFTPEGYRLIAGQVSRELTRLCGIEFDGSLP